MLLLILLPHANSVSLDSFFLVGVLLVLALLFDQACVWQHLAVLVERVLQIREHDQVR